MGLSPELKKIVANFERKWGVGIANLGPKWEAATPIPTGSARLDAALTLGGIPKGRIIEIYGLESSGKTSFMLWMLAQHKKNFPNDKRPFAIVDVEHSIATNFLRGFGVDPDDCLFVYPKSAEQGLQAVLDLTLSGAVSVILVDSVDGLQNENMLGKEIGEADVQGISKFMGQTLRQVSKSCVDNDVSVWFINQIRDSLKMYGNPTTTPGGHALPFYACVRLQTMQKKPSDAIPGAFQFRVKVIKNKCGPDNADETLIDFVKAKGPDCFQDIIGFAKDLGILRHAGSATYIRLNGPDQPEEKYSGGAAGVRATLLADPKLYDKLRTVCLSYTAPVPVKVPPPEET